MNPISSPLSREVGEEVSAISTASDANQQASLLLDAHFARGRSSDPSEMEPNFGQAKESLLDSGTGDANGVPAGVSSGPPSGSVRFIRVEENPNRSTLRETTAPLSPPAKPPSKAFLGSNSPLSAGGRPPRAPIASDALPSASLLTAFSSNRCGGPSPAPPSLEYAEIELKQSELRQAVEHRLRSLEQALDQREEELLRVHTKLRKMEEDYTFNYNLIAERDQALEESGQKLQQLYREVKRATAEATTVAEKLHTAENENARLKQRVREVEADREATTRRIQKEYWIKEQHFQETFKAKEAALEAERQRVHEQYIRQAQEIEASRHEIEGYTVNATSEWAQRHQQVVERLQAELEQSQKKLQSATEANNELAGRVKRAEEETTLLRKQFDYQAQRQDASVEEALQANRRLESQLAETNVLLNKSVITAENAIREETQKNSRLEIEKTHLQTSLAEAQERIQQLISQRQEEVSRDSAERHELQTRYQNAQREMQVVQEGWREAERRLQAALVTQKNELDQSTRERQEAERSQQALCQQLTAKEREFAECQQELARLAGHVESWKAAESATAAKYRQEVVDLQEKLLNMEQALQLARDEAELSKRNALDIQERSQEAVARFTRELHASEAARRALEDQFHRSKDYNAQETFINSLCHEKEILEKRILDLERTNSEIREQVANFTLELQNDPAVKSAREMHRRVDQLQQDLLESRYSNQRLQDALKEKEEELARYQVDILRAQILLSSGEDPTDNLGTRDDGFSGLLRHHQRDWTNIHMQPECKDHVRRQNKCIRPHKARFDASSRSRSSVSNASDASHSNGSSAKQNLHSKGEKGFPRRGARSRGKTHYSVISSSFPFPSPVNPDRSVSGGVPLKEGEVWRQKSYQLEQHLRKVLLERDRLSRELQLAKQDVVSLSSEKQSLLDLNSLLKAQLREAYRTAYEANTVSRGALSSSAHPHLRRGASERQDTMATPLEQLPATASATLRKQQGRKQSDTLLVRPHGQTAKSSDENVRSAAIASLALEVEGHGRGAGGGLSEHHIAEQFGSPIDSTTVGEPPNDHQQGRLEALEEEIRFVKAQIANTVHQHQQSQQQHPAVTRSARRGLGAGDGVPVIRKGIQAVRHYGHH